MREAGEPSTGASYPIVTYGVPAPPGTVMVASPQVPRNTQQGKVKAAPNAMV
jgi:hypothetical protein